MKLHGRILAFCFSLILVSSLAFAQEDVLRPHGGPRATGEESTNYLYRRSPFTLGVEGGLNYNMFSQDLIWNNPVPTNSPESVRKSGTGFSPFFGALIDFSLSNSIGLQLRVNYDQKYFSNKYTGQMDAQNIDGTNSLIPVEVQYTNTLQYVGLTALLRFNINPDLFITAGPFIEFPFEKFSFTYDANIVADGYTFTGTGQRSFHQSSDTLTGLLDRVGLEIGVGYKIPISKSVYLVPQARFQLMASKVANDEDFVPDIWQPITNGITSYSTKNEVVHSLQLALALWFDL